MIKIYIVMILAHLISFGYWCLIQSLVENDTLEEGLFCGVVVALGCTTIGFLVGQIVARLNAKSQL